MAKYEKVRVVRLESDRGVYWKSLRHEHEYRIIGVVQTNTDVVGCVKVKFPTAEGLLDVPRSLLESVRR